MPTMPALFIAHSAPPLALDPIAGEDYKRLSENLPKPSAILVFSAHWEGAQLALGEISQHDVPIYDFGGFQPELYELQYPAPGAPRLADKIHALLDKHYTLANSERGLDHGVWVPFLHMWPDADIPILQMSMPYNFSDQALFELGQQLSPLRENNILIVGTGGITHNLRTVSPHHTGNPPAWAMEFDQWIASTLVNHEYNKLIDWQSQAPQANMNHPTPEHFRPLLIVAGAAQHEPVTFPITGFEWGSMSRRAVQLG
ncbi:DODA-type extradiol aromatic ring-opening family dioxygenase [Kaarinaea lacus]